MPSFFKRGKQVKNNPNKKDGINHNLPQPLNISLAVNLDFINQKTGNSSDIVIRTKKIGTHTQLTTAVLYVEGMVNEQSIQDFLIESMMNNSKDLNALGPQEALEKLAEDVVSLGHVTWVQEWDALFLSLMSGNTIILVDGVKKALNVSTKGGEKRAIEEPSSQVTVRGPRDGFTESLSTNTTLIRKRINSPNLWVESMQIGRVTNTKVAMVYVHGIANDKIVNEVRRRLKAIDIDSILESGYIEQLIEDQTSTTFPTLYHTERPDSVAGNLLEGRVAIIVDGTPFVLLAPAIFIQFFQAVEDYYARFDISTALRFLRILIFFISIIAPATFVAATTFHQEMIPTNLVIAIAAQRETVPFPAFVEAAMMEVTFEILREAGIRLPRAVGSAISIVGALVIGQAAVQAGIVTPAMVIIVSITAIANFATPSFAMAISARLIRFAFMVAAALFGFYGVILGLIMLILHLCGLRSFGVPYMTPIAPVIPAELGDTFIRVPWWALWRRPSFISSNRTRKGKNKHPQPPRSRGIVNTDMEQGDRNES